MDFQPILEPTVFSEIPQDLIIDDIIILAQCCDNVVNWLRTYGLLARRMRCCCGVEMYETHSSHFQDGYEWRCSPCRRECSIRHGSFFTPSKIPLPLMFKFLYYWSEDLQSHAFLEKHLGWSPNTVVDWKNYLRDICLEEILMNPQSIGGPGKIVEIDESKFGKRKYNRGRLLTGQWVFGMVERDTDDIIMVTVPDRSTATLLPIIQRFIHPQTIIYSDEWASYNILSHSGYTHYTVNHSEIFVDPVTHVHTQKIEGSWGGVKKRQKKGQTTNPELLETHLIEACWRRRHKKNIFGFILRGIRDLYPVI